LKKNLQKCEALSRCVVLEVTAEQDEGTGAEDEATGTIRLRPGSYPAVCTSLSHLFTKCGVEKEFCEYSRYM
jgi:hypothetical protein